MVHKQEICVFIGARPNIPKMRSLSKALRLLLQRQVLKSEPTIIHTGQHYSDNMGLSLCDELNISVDQHLAIGPSTTDAQQLSSLVAGIETTLKEFAPKIVIVIGDTNSALASSVIASRMGFWVVHLEAGRRSGDRDPEETNRKVITACSKFHLCPSRQTVENLLSENISKAHVFLVGNTMAETFCDFGSARRKCTILTKLALRQQEYVLATFHKPETLSNLAGLAGMLSRISRKLPVVFPCHPRTEQLMEVMAVNGELAKAVKLVKPVSYVEYTTLLEKACCVVTDSSGSQEEATVSGTPCYTLARSTARPETVTEGTNKLIGLDFELPSPPDVHSSKRQRIDYWDENVSTRTAVALERILGMIEELST